MGISRHRLVSLLLLVLIVLAPNSSIHGADPQTAAARAQSAPSQSAAGEEKDTSHRDHTDQDLVIEQSSTDVVFSDDGTGKQELSVRIRIQSEAAVKQFGVLTFPYRNDIDRFETFLVQVRKPDGRIVTTPESNVQDLPAQVTREAPTYSDLREKQVPVKALGIGDVLEWRISTVHAKAEVPGQFWFVYNFTKDHVTLQEVLRITVPASKYVKVSSPSLSPEVHEERGCKVYLWKTSRPELPKDDEAKKPPRLHPRPDVQLTTFRSWEQVGQWYGALQRSKIEVSPLVRAKAAELTQGLTSNIDKQRAIYQFVTTKFRYISILLTVHHASLQLRASASRQYDQLKTAGHAKI